MTKKMGRPRLAKNQAKGVLIGARFSPVEAKKVSDAARQANLTKSQWVRETAPGSIKGMLDILTLWVYSPTMSALPEVFPPQTRSQPKRGPRCGMNRTSALTQALDQRDFAFQQAKALQSLPPIANTLEARMRAQTLRDLNTVWDTSCERAMILQGKGKPKSVPARNDPTAKQSKAKPVTPTETPQ